MSSPGLKSPPAEEQDAHHPTSHVTLSGRLLQAGEANLSSPRSSQQIKGDKPIDMYRARTREDWKKLLGRERYLVMRYRKFERPSTGPYHDFNLKPEQDGVFLCYACKSIVFDALEFEQTNSGWPAFRSFIAEQCMKTYGEEQACFEYFCAHCEGFLGKSLYTGVNSIQVSGYAIEFKPMSSSFKEATLTRLGLIATPELKKRTSFRNAAPRGAALQRRLSSSENVQAMPSVLPHKFSGNVRSPDANPSNKVSSRLSGLLSPKRNSRQNSKQ